MLYGATWKHRALGKIIKYIFKLLLFRVSFWNNSSNVLPKYSRENTENLFSISYLYIYYKRNKIIFLKSFYIVNNAFINFCTTSLSLSYFLFNEILRNQEIDWNKYFFKEGKLSNNLLMEYKTSFFCNKIIQTNFLIIFFQ